MNLPNFLTILRVLLIPFFIFFFYQGSTQGSIVSASIFFVASLTDLLDGYLARRRSEVTQFGKFLDPVADKLLIVSALILLVGNGRVPAWMAIIIIGREFAVTGFRAIASSEGVIIAAEGTGKYKMFVQIIAVILLTVDLPSIYFHQVGLLLLMISMVLALFSAGQYFIKFIRRVNLLKVK
jgi:CDP-diacylglycerol--glycerol-3-phosphate 3-phosphatidyltransferase